MPRRRAGMECAIVRRLAAPFGELDRTVTAGDRGGEKPRLEEAIQTLANGGLTSRCTRPELAVTFGPEKST